MRFEHPEKSLTEADLRDAEAELGFSLPPELRKQYLKSNGGSPDPYVYVDDKIETTVSEFLPLRRGSEGDTSVDAYFHFAADTQLVPQSFFPFAVDSGGDYFFVDAASIGGDVYLYRADTAGQHLILLGVTVDRFWSLLRSE